jgi:hypothetical protein
MKGEIIINAAITGSIHTPTMSPHLPSRLKKKPARGSGLRSWGGCLSPQVPLGLILEYEKPPVLTSINSFRHLRASSLPLASLNLT